MNNALIISPEFKELKFQESSQHFFAEIVLIDRTNDGSESVLMAKEHLQEEDSLSALKHGILTLQKDPFMIMGEAATLVRNQKQIILKNGNIITYKYLIIYSGIQDTSEFEATLRTLFHALLISKKAPLISKLAKVEEFNLQNRTLLSQSLSPNMIKRVVHQNLCETDLQSPFNLLNTIKRLSEVQI